MFLWDYIFNNLIYYIQIFMGEFVMTQKGPDQPVPPQQPNSQSTHPYNYPQPGYGQYTQPQQNYNQPPTYQQPSSPPGQWNSSGVYGGPPPVKKSGIPWWGWLIIAFVFLTVVGIISNTITTLSKNS